MPERLDSTPEEMGIRENRVKNTMSGVEGSNLDTEVDLILEDPKMTGVNIDQRLLVDERAFWTPEKLMKFAKERGDKLGPKDVARVGEILEIRREEELRKLGDFVEYLSRFGGKLQHVRINPASEKSPVSPSQAIEVNEDGSFEVPLGSQFGKQVEMITKRCPDTTLVVPFYDHRKGREASNVPETEEQIEQYIAICREILERFGDRIQLEIGNEPNVTRSTGLEFADKLQFATEANPQSYAHFYCRVVSNLKRDYPSARFALAGLAEFDPTYLNSVLGEVKRFEEDNETGCLIDTISFHPYRESSREACVEVRDAVFQSTEGTYLEQLRRFLETARRYNRDVEVTVGEIGFEPGLEGWSERLREANRLTAEQGIKSYIYPLREHM